jgi:hypothetical protein
MKKTEKNYVVYMRETGNTVSYHVSEGAADKAARKIDPSLRNVTYKRIK